MPSDLYSGDKTLAELIEEHQGGSSSTTFSYDEFFLDPLFWQCIGKGMGWDESAVDHPWLLPLAPFH